MLVVNIGMIVRLFGCMVACRCGMCYRVSCSSCTLAAWAAADTGVGIQLEGGPGKVLRANFGFLIGAPLENQNLTNC